MGRGPHLYRRGAVYYWQRRLPNQFAIRLRISHVKVNLKTKDVAIARRLVAPLDARAAEVFMGDAGQIDKVQLGSIFKSVLLEHQAKLGLLANIERDRPTVERSVLLEDELAQGVAYTLLAEQGVDARLDTAWQKRLTSEGHGDSFLIKVIEHLERLRDDEGIKVSRRKLAMHVQRAGAEVSAINLTCAQPVYLRALGSALLAAEQRYGGEPKWELDFAALIEEVERGAATPVAPATAAVAEIAPLTEPPPIPHGVEAATETIQAPLSGSILFVGQNLDCKRRQDNEWDDKTGRQAKFIFALFARFMREVHSIDALCAVKQSDLADFDSFLRGLHSNFGKSVLIVARN